MSPDKEHAPALMQQAADEAVLPERLIELSEMLSIEKPALSLALLTAARTITRLQFRTRYTDIGEVSGVYEQGVAAGLEMAAKVAGNVSSTQSNAPAFSSGDYAEGWSKGVSSGGILAAQTIRALSKESTK